MERARKMPPVCIECGEKNFKEVNIPHSSEVRGETIEVITPSFVCQNCGATLMDSTQMNQFRKVSADQYRINHQLLTSNEIVTCRKKLGMSQMEFAKYLKVGIASIKRWETYFVQDESQDELIRLKCDRDIANINALEIGWKSQEPSNLNGQRRFSWGKFKNLIIAFIEVFETPLHINKALFYADFRHYRLFSVSITGARYVRLEYGPCPDDYAKMYERMILDREITRINKHALKGLFPFDHSLFDDHELETISAINSIGKDKGKNYLLDLSHREKGYEETPSFTSINYDFAESLKITL